MNCNHIHYLLHCLLSYFNYEMRYSKISATDKQRLYDVHLANGNYIELAKQLNIKPTTAYAVIRRAVNRNGQVTSTRRRARQQS